MCVFVHVHVFACVCACVCMHVYMLRDMCMNGGYMHSAGKASICTVHVMYMYMTILWVWLWLPRLWGHDVEETLQQSTGLCQKQAC